MLPRGNRGSGACSPSIALSSFASSLSGGEWNSSRDAALGVRWHRIMPARTHRQTLAGAALVAVALALLLWAGFGASASRDDGWRRTSAGWQRLPTAAAHEAPPRWDAHPAVLVLVQAAAALAAMRAFPRPGQTRLGWLEEDWRDFFRRSFRASAFGA
jgi:hypothetical protein